MHVHYRCRSGWWANNVSVSSGSVSSEALGPVAICGTNGKYTTAGFCEEVRCLSLPHVSDASLRIRPGEAQALNYSFGENVSYDCAPSHRGSVTAVCGQDGSFAVSGKCLVVCTSPPTVEHASLRNATSTDLSNGVTLGEKLIYDCDTSAGFGGIVKAECRDNGNFTLRSPGVCVKICPNHPPNILNAEPQLEAHEHHLVTVGTHVPYLCVAGYGGEISAVCDLNGHYTVHGSCARVCPLSTIPVLPRATPRFNTSSNGSKASWTVGYYLTYKCDAGYRGEPRVVCDEHGTWQVEPGLQCEHLGCGPIAGLLASCVPGVADAPSGQTASDSPSSCGQDGGGQRWGDTMLVNQTFNLTSDTDGDVLVFRCKTGYVGQPFALCVKRAWGMYGSCAPERVSYSGGQMAGSSVGVAFAAVGLTMAALKKCGSVASRGARDPTAPPEAPQVHE